MLNDIIKKARLEHGYSEAELCDRTGLSLHELGDIESYEDEILTAVPVAAVIRLCRALDMSLSKLLGLPAGRDSATMPIGKYVEHVRTLAGIGQEQLDDLVGYDQGFIAKVEAGAVDLREIPLELGMEIADHTNSSRSAMANHLEAM